MASHRRWRSPRHRPSALHRVASAVVLLSAATAVTLALMIGYVIVGRPPGGGTGPAAPADAGSPSAAAQTAAPVRSPDENRVPATPEAMLGLLLTFLPNATTSHYAKHVGRELMVDLQVDHGQGPARLRVAIAPDLTPQERTDRSCRVRVHEECAVLPDGSIAHIQLGTITNCLQEAVVELDRPTGTHVRIEVGRCLVNDPGPAPRKEQLKEYLSRFPPEAIGVRAAIAVAADDRWGWTMPRELVEAGQRDFPALPEVADWDRPAVVPQL